MSFKSTILGYPACKLKHVIILSLNTMSADWSCWQNRFGAYSRSTTRSVKRMHCQVCWKQEPSFGIWAFDAHHQQLPLSNEPPLWNSPPLFCYFLRVLFHCFYYSFHVSHILLQNITCSLGLLPFIALRRPPFLNKGICLLPKLLWVSEPRPGGGTQVQCRGNQRWCVSTKCSCFATKWSWVPAHESWIKRASLRVVCAALFSLWQ